MGNTRTWGWLVGLCVVGACTSGPTAPAPVIEWTTALCLENQGPADLCDQAPAAWPYYHACLLTAHGDLPDDDWSQYCARRAVIDWCQRFVSDNPNRDAVCALAYGGR